MPEEFLLLEITCTICPQTMVKVLHPPAWHARLKPPHVLNGATCVYMTKCIPHIGVYIVVCYAIVCITLIIWYLRPVQCYHVFQYMSFTPCSISMSMDIEPGNDPSTSLRDAIVGHLNAPAVCSRNHIWLNHSDIPSHLSLWMHRQRNWRIDRPMRTSVSHSG